MSAKESSGMVLLIFSFFLVFFFAAVTHFAVTILFMLRYEETNKHKSNSICIHPDRIFKIYSCFFLLFEVI